MCTPNRLTNQPSEEADMADKDSTGADAPTQPREEIMKEGEALYRRLPPKGRAIAQAILKILQPPDVDFPD